MTIAKPRAARALLDLGTREEILAVASNLFAVHGYHGTTTREIAKAVGIRQPSLFHHFESKAAIMDALLAHDLERAVPARERVARSAQPAPVRLYKFLHDEVIHLAGSRYNLAGVYTEEVRASSEFETWHRHRGRLHRAIEAILRDGMRDGDFVATDPFFVREAIFGVLGRTLTRYSGGQMPPDAALPDQVASLILRAVLIDPTHLDGIRAAASAVT